MTLRRPAARARCSRSSALPARSVVRLLHPQAAAAAGAGAVLAHLGARAPRQGGDEPLLAAQAPALAAACSSRCSRCWCSRSAIRGRGDDCVEGRNLVVLVDASASMKATDVTPSRLDAAKDEVEKLVRGLGRVDRMLIAQMDAALTPLLDDDRRDDRARAGRRRRSRASDTRADLRARRCASRSTRCAACRTPRSSSSPTARSATRAEPPGAVDLGDAAARASCRSARAARTWRSPSSRCGATRSTSAATR